MKIEYLPKGINNFHNAPSIILSITGATDPIDGGYIISKGQQNRIAKRFCGVTDCKCSAGGATQRNEEGTSFSIPREFSREV